MPIYCKELEDIIEKWKTKKYESETGFELYSKKKMKELIDNLTLKDILIGEEIAPDRTCGKLQIIKSIKINKKLNSKI